MTSKESKELERSEPVRGPTLFEEAERWFEAAFRRPFSLFGHRWVLGFRPMEMEEVSPSLDIFEENGNVVIKAELPGITGELFLKSSWNRSTRLRGRKDFTLIRLFALENNYIEQNKDSGK